MGHAGLGSTGGGFTWTSGTLQFGSFVRCSTQCRPCSQVGPRATKLSSGLVSTPELIDSNLFSPNPGSRAGLGLTGAIQVGRGRPRGSRHDGAVKSTLTADFGSAMHFTRWVGSTAEICSKLYPSEFQGNGVRKNGSNDALRMLLKVSIREGAWPAKFGLRGRRITT